MQSESEIMIHMTDVIDVRRTLFAQSRYLDSHAIAGFQCHAIQNRSK